MTDGRSARAASPCDLVLLDLGLPDTDGLDVCRELRARGAVPIIVISARAGGIDRVVGLERGADDYVGFQSYQTYDQLSAAEGIPMLERSLKNFATLHSGSELSDCSNGGDRWWRRSGYGRRTWCWSA
nr:hypothetical protein Ade03nite_87440 [Actinoplanes derwentensis]